MHLPSRISHRRSIRKRAISERGDSDYEDLKMLINGESPTSDCGIRRRVSDRKGSIFYVSTPDRISKLDELESEESNQEVSNYNLTR